MASIQSQTNSLEPVTPPIPRSTPAGPRRELPGEHRFRIGGINWAAYRQIADALPGRHFHMSYDGEDLELMTISGEHGGYSRLMAFMVMVLTEELGLPRLTCGDMTLNREDLERGIEPDESFYITNEPKVRGKKIDLTVDPPPDLGIEIDLTTDSRRRFGIYAKIAVPEIWRYDGNSTIIFQRKPDGQYVSAAHSLYFPFVSAADLDRFLQQRDQIDEAGLLRSFRQWVRDRIASAK